MRFFLSLTFCFLSFYSIGQAKPDILLRGGPFSYSKKLGVKPYLDLSPGIHSKQGLGIGIGVGYTSIPETEVSVVPIFARISYLPFDAPVSPAFEFQFGHGIVNSTQNNITYSGGLYLHVSGGIGFDIKKNRGLLLQAGYGKLALHEKTYAGPSLGTVDYDGWMALFGFKF